MDRETAREKIRETISCLDYLEKAPKEGYICPFCGSGTGPNHSGALHYYKDTNTWACFDAECAANAGAKKARTGDVIALYMQVRGVDYNTALAELAARIGITIDHYSPAGSQGGRTEDPKQQGNTDTGQAEKPQEQAAEAAEQAQEADYTAYYRACRQRLQDPAALAYLKQRGISEATAAAYWLGFDPAADPASAPGVLGNEYRPHPAPRLIIPVTKGHYVARRTDGGETFKKLNPAGCTPGIFNAKVLYETDRPIFVTEGAIDALSIIEAGAPAVALNSAVNADVLVNMLSEKPTTATLILCLDNDGGGLAGAEKLKAGLRLLNVSYITANISGAEKDPNDAMVKDPDSFAAAILEAQRRTAARPDNSSFYIEHFMQQDIEKFKKSQRKTGFEILDRKSGGLFSGLYVLAALSSLGKTSFALQLADQLAQAGAEIIFFSMEQSKLELVSKSINRAVALKYGVGPGCNALKVRSGNWTPGIQAAAAEYMQKIGDRFSVIEGNFNCDVTFISDYVRRYIDKTAARPVVFIDYLQVLEPGEQPGQLRQSTREAVDSAVKQLTQLSRELNIIIVLISSVNRSNYLTPIDFESLKESGGIEYTADAVWGMQLKCLNDDIFSGGPGNIKEKRETIRNNKKAEPRDIELVCLKNRFGISSFNCFFQYYAGNDLFVEVPGIDDDTPAPRQITAARKL